MSAWYVEHLGMKVAASSDSPPYATFVSDSAGRSMLELYNREDPAPSVWRDRDAGPEGIGRVGQLPGRKRRSGVAGTAGAGGVAWAA